jgi:membrane associated rhomboid family serine protease
MSRRVSLQIPDLPTPALNALVGLNLATFAMWWLAAASGDDAVVWMERNATVSVATLREGALWTLLTSELSHVSPLHLAFNMLALITFGRDVERLLGARGFLHLYVAGAVTASVGHVVYNAVSGVDVPALGASGAVMSVAVVSALLYPSRLLLLFFVIPMPVTWGVLLFVLIDLWGLFGAGAGQIAHAAHLGGAAYGLLYWRFEARSYIIERLVALGVIRGQV